MAGIVSDSTKEQIRAASDIVDVIGSYLPLKRAGANFSTLCPFHKEKSPSFSVNPHRQIFYCFGCHKGGDVFTFVKEYENISFPEALQRLADRASIPLEYEQNKAGQEARHLKDTLLQIHEQITQRWQIALQSDAGGQIARDYLAKRGVSDEAVKLFRIGYAPEAWDDSVNWGKSKGFEPAIMEQAGLVIRKDDGDRYYDRFRGRLMFPISDEQGRVVGFSGRILAGDEKIAKYVNSPETPIFTKGKIFYGLDKSKRAILDAGFAIICEGQLDLIACYMAGVKNMVAPQGTAFTPEHARILKRYVDEVVLCFDSDNAGQNAAVRVLDSLLGNDLAVKVAIVPAPHDPDSFIKAEGGAAFQSLMLKAEGFFDFHLKRLCETNDITTDKGRMTVVQQMVESVQKANSAVLSDTYAQKTAQRLGVMADSVRAEFKKGRRALVRHAENAEEPTASHEPAVQKASEREQWLMRYVLLGDDSHVAWAQNHLDLGWIEHDGVRQIIRVCLEAHQEGNWHGIPSLLDRFEEETIRGMITQAVAEEMPREDLDRKLSETIRLLRNDWIEKQLGQLTRRVADPAITQEAFAEIERQKTTFRQQKAQPLQPVFVPGEA
ncbi:MAG TPA: DNA primase [Candidatus Saccharimonadales bacterium]|nr:DNA primase [Candidatus Saccharimonadales bacterium]